MRQWLTSLNIFSSSSLNRQIDGQTPFFGHITHFFPIGVVSFILLRQSHSQPRYQIILRTQTGQQFHMYRAIWQHLWSIGCFTELFDDTYYRLEVLQTVFLSAKEPRPYWCHKGWTSSGVCLQSWNSTPIISIKRCL